MSANLGEILARENLISPQHLSGGSRLSARGTVVDWDQSVKLGLVSDDMITAVFRQDGIPSVNLELFHIDESVLRPFLRRSLKNIQFCPFSRRSHSHAGYGRSDKRLAMDDIKFMTGFEFDLS